MQNAIDYEHMQYASVLLRLYMQFATIVIRLI